MAFIFFFFGLHRRYPTIVSSPAACEKGIAKIPDRMPCRLLSMTILLSAALHLLVRCSDEIILIFSYLYARNYIELMCCEKRIQIENIIKREKREKRLKIFLESYTYAHILKIK